MVSAKGNLWKTCVFMLVSLIGVSTAKAQTPIFYKTLQGKVVTAYPEKCLPPAQDCSGKSKAWPRGDTVIKAFGNIRRGKFRQVDFLYYSGTKETKQCWPYERKIIAAVKAWEKTNQSSSGFKVKGVDPSILETCVRHGPLFVESSRLGSIPSPISKSPTEAKASCDDCEKKGSVAAVVKTKKELGISEDFILESGRNHAAYDLVMKYSGKCLLSPDATADLFGTIKASKNYKNFEAARSRFSSTSANRKSPKAEVRKLAEANYAKDMAEDRRLRKIVNNGYDLGFKGQWDKQVRPQISNGELSGIKIKGRNITAYDIKIIDALARSLMAEGEGCQFNYRPPESIPGHYSLIGRVLYDRRMLNKRTIEAGPQATTNNQSLYSAFGRPGYSRDSGAAWEEAISAPSQISAWDVFDGQSSSMNNRLAATLCPTIPENERNYPKQSIGDFQQQVWDVAVAYALYFYSLTDSDDEWLQNIIAEQQHGKIPDILRQDERIPLIRRSDGAVLPRVLSYTHGVALDGGTEVTQFTIGGVRLRPDQGCPQTRIWKSAGTEAGAGVVSVVSKRRRTTKLLPLKELRDFTRDRGT